MLEAGKLDSLTDEVEPHTGSEKKSASFSAEQLRKDLQIRDSDLDGCMTEQASLYAYYSTLYAKAQYEADHAKSQVEVLRAKKYSTLRNAKAGRGVKFTEAQLEAEVARSADVIEAINKANLARMRATIIKEGLEAFKQRRDMLVQKGKARLEERKGELYLKGVESEETHAQRIERIKRESKI
ncbi:hypothetical protein N7I40_004046 [Vibrio parahaemolyticus]|nr:MULTISPECIES: hypothetical protein [Vibrio harveyi group]EGR3221676.1 hypothetical protein [Vibrio parahaemolyticus]EHK6545789.1 hypothetical protein [Vibrio parahaemolyticus]EJL8716098.1 hypothetical protein [Vibrio alginolyticus]EJV5946420.1 hypothetical protein [Vibrio parahaemolyticus]EKN4564921.1 hypothetical protein [Vibrio parahaemolyticus]